MAAVVGVNLSLILLSVEPPNTDTDSSDLGGCSSTGRGELDATAHSSVNVLCQCARTYLGAIRDHRPGLSTSYYAVLTSSQVKQILNKKVRRGLGKWHPLVTATGDHVMPREGGGESRSDLTPLEDVIDALDGHTDNWKESDSEDEQVGGALMPLANQIHLLMDSVPSSKLNEYVVMDVYWVAAGAHFSPPSTSICMFEALLRVRAWQNAYIHIVIPSRNHNMWRTPLREWKEAVGVARVWSASQWTLQSGDIWRGSIGISEQKGQASRQTLRSRISLPGFALYLSPDVPDSALSPSLLERVGVWPRYCPSHLEMLQAVDLSTFPLSWLSPLHCKLSMSCPTPSSVDLFRVLLNSSNHNKNVGYLMCLCQSCTNPDPDTPTPSRRTSDWVSHMQTREDVLEEDRDVLNCLSSYETGPVLLARPCISDQSDSSTVSCDTWFLWKPDAVDASLYTHRLTMANDEGFEGLKVLSRQLGVEYDNFVGVTSLLPFMMGSQESTVLPCDWMELKAFKTHEGIQRKLIKRVVTADLMFGHMPAPPPTTGHSDILQVSEMLDLFTEEGLPVDSTTLSPIAVTTPSKPTRVYSAAVKELTYHSIISSTPTYKTRRYHGVDYCFSDQDANMDSKLCKIQQACIIRERASHCSDVRTPLAERSKREQRRKALLHTDDATKEQTAVGRGEERGAGVEERPAVTRTGRGVVQPKGRNKPKLSTRRTAETLKGRGKDGVGRGKDGVVREERKEIRLLRNRPDRGRGGKVGAREGTIVLDKHKNGEKVDDEKVAAGEASVGKESEMDTPSVTICDKIPTVEVSKLKLTPRTMSKRLLKLRLRTRRKDLVRVEVKGDEEVDRVEIKGDMEVHRGTEEGEEVTTGSQGIEAEDEGAQGRWEEDGSEEISVQSHKMCTSERDGEDTNVDGVTVGNDMLPMMDVGADGIVEQNIAASSGEGMKSHRMSAGGTSRHRTTSVGGTSEHRTTSAGGTSGHRTSSDKSSTSEGKKDRRKTLLGEAVVRALKKHGMPRTHQHFRDCYNKLYKIGKTFMEDVKLSSYSPGSLKRKITKVVELNVRDVIDLL